MDILLTNNEEGIQGEKIMGEKESLADMIEEKEKEENSESINSIDKTIYEDEENGLIDLIPLSEWFSNNSDKFKNISPINADLDGIDSDDLILVSIPHPKGGTTSRGEEKRVLKKWEDSSSFPILDLDGESMNFYNNGFRIIYNYNDDIYIRCYGIKAGLIIIFCKNIEGLLIPYYKTKLDRNANEIKIVEAETSEIITSLAEDINIEELEVRYPQTSKYKNKNQIKTKNDAVIWLLGRMEIITDINHHLQIEKVILELLA